MDSLLAIYRQTCRNHYFEKCTQNAHKNGYIKIPIYLSLGSEHIPPTVLSYFDNPLLFPQHRSHSWLLSAGAPAELMAKELLGRQDGINGGMGGSPSMSWKPNVFGHSGLLGDQVPIAVGAAHASGRQTICVLGDAAAEEDYVLGALGFAATHKVPILFVVEDNNLSILTEKSVRRSWDIVDVAKSMGITAINTFDYQLNHLMSGIEALSLRLPALININLERQVWHAGSGEDHVFLTTPVDRLKDTFSETYDDHFLNDVARNEERNMEELWQRLLKQ